MTRQEILDQIVELEEYQETCTHRYSEEWYLAGIDIDELYNQLEIAA